MFNILNSIDTAYYFGSIPDSIEAEAEWIKRRDYKRKNRLEYNYVINFEEKLVGGCGIKINQDHDHIGEIGYFVDKNYTGKGVATLAVEKLEKIGFDELNLVRLEIIMALENKASEKVAVKNNFIKEGLLHKAVKINGNYHDCLLYAKVI